MNEQLVVGIVDSGQKLVELARAFAEPHRLSEGKALIAINVEGTSVTACLAGEANSIATALYSAMDTLLENNCEHQVLAILTRMAKKLYERRNNGRETGEAE